MTRSMKSMGALWLGAFIFVAGGWRATVSAEAPKTPGDRPTLKAEDAKDFIGDWALDVKSQRGESKGSLSIKDNGGMAVAHIQMRQGSEHLVTNITKTAEGLLLQYTVDAQGNQMKMKVALKRDGEKLAGTAENEGGNYKMELVGTKGEAPAADAAPAGRGGRPGARGGAGGAQRGLRNNGASGEDEAGGGFLRAGARASLKIKDKEILIIYGDLTTKSADYKQFASMKDGDVLKPTQSIAYKLKSGVGLKFGDTVIKSENAAKGYPGVYSLWLKKSGDGWKLVFNNEADVWGTMYNAAANAAEVTLTTGKPAADVEKLVIELKAEGDSGGTFRMAVGDHEWTAKFTAE